MPCRCHTTVTKRSGQMLSITCGLMLEQRGQPCDRGPHDGRMPSQRPPDVRARRRTSSCASPRCRSDTLLGDGASHAAVPAASARRLRADHSQCQSPLVPSAARGGLAVDVVLQRRSVLEQMGSMSTSKVMTSCGRGMIACASVCRRSQTAMLEPRCRRSLLPFDGRASRAS